MNVYRKIRRRAASFLDFFRHDIRYGVENLVTWFPIIWEDRGWDHYYLLRMMSKKLRSMSVQHRDYGVCLGADRKARQLLIASVLCDRLIKDEYLDNVIKTMYHGKLTRSSVKQSVAMQLADQEMLGNLLAKHVTHWWD